MGEGPHRHLLRRRRRGASRRRSAKLVDGCAHERARRYYRGLDHGRLEGEFITTIAWVASCHYAAVNFGQYLYAGFMPNHPSLTRKLIPEEDSPEWEQMQADPEHYLMSMLLNPVLARINMTTIKILATHASNEEYLGQRPDGWTSNPKVEAPFAKFSKAVEEVDALIKSRNKNPALKNRNGPTQLPYELLRPLSGPGLTKRGIPNSVSI